MIVDNQDRNKKADCDRIYIIAIHDTLVITEAMLPYHMARDLGHRYNILSTNVRA